MADRIHYEEIVRYEGGRVIVDRAQTRYDRPGVRLLLGFAEDGGGWAWASPGSVEKLSTVFLGMPNENHAPEPGEPLRLWQQIPHTVDSCLWSDIGWSQRCMYSGLPESSSVHPKEDSE
ncbi:hypothetical protein ACIQVK_18770 [Streptomyces sp. NPDC090493]|uniref:hypothetical protein n=1 Tax=Streptomyces sp. NPDC090493 TaxID=3365964 RepID=UPI0037F29133